MTLQTNPLVVHIIDSLPPDGAERLIVDVLKNRSDEFDYIVLCLIAGGPLEEELKDIGVPVTIFGKKGKFDISLFFKLYRWLRSERPVVVHTHLFTADCWGRVAAIMSGVPGIFSTVHSVNRWYTLVHRTIDLVLSLFSTKIIACTSEVANTLQKKEHIASKRIENIPNGTDLKRFKNVDRLDLESEFGVADNVVRLAVIGRLHSAKGHLDLLPVMARLKDEGLDFHLLLVGDGELRDKIENMIEGLGLERFVTMTGYRTDIPNILASIDVVLMPSLWEGLPMALLEGMAMGKAVLASSVGGIPDAIEDGYNGFLFEAGDAETLTEKIRKLLRDKNLRESLGAKAKITVETKYNAVEVSRRYESLYRSVSGP